MTLIISYKNSFPESVTIAGKDLEQLTKALEFIKYTYKVEGDRFDDLYNVIDISEGISIYEKILGD